MARDLPVRVARVGGAVKTFDEPRVAYKSVATKTSGNAVATLVVPSGSRVVYPARPAHSWNSNKLRVERVFVDVIEGDETDAVGPHARSFVYEEGTVVDAEEFNDDPQSHTGGGIYCFETRKGAEHWGCERKATPKTA